MKPARAKRAVINKMIGNNFVFVLNVMKFCKKLLGVKERKI